MPPVRAVRFWIMPPALELLSLLFGPCPKAEPGQPAPSSPVEHIFQTITERVKEVQKIPQLKSLTGLVSALGQTDIIPPVTGKTLQVLAFSLTTISTAAIVCKFISGGASKRELWAVILQGPGGASTGANLTTNYPGSLFATERDDGLALNLGATGAVYWSVRYWESE